MSPAAGQSNAHLQALLSAAFPWGATVSLHGAGSFVSLRYEISDLGSGADGPALVNFVRDPGDTDQWVPISALERASIDGYLELDNGYVRRPSADDMHLLATPLNDFVGPQAASDPTGSFKARMRLHQSWWRTFRLRRPPGVGPGRSSERHRGNMLRAEDGSLGHNFCSPESFSSFRGRSSSNQPGFNSWATGHNLMTSQAMAVNVFGHLRHHPSVAARLFAELLDEESCAEVVAIEIERTSDAIGDRTAFDAYVTREGAGCLAIETKLTEPFSQEQYDWGYYLRLPAAQTNRWTTSDPSLLGDPRWSQLWRNHLLAIAECSREHAGNHLMDDHDGGVDGNGGSRSRTGSGSRHHPRVLVVHHPEDPDCARAVEGYRQLLADPNDVIGVDLARIVQLLGPIVAGNAAHERWLRNVEDRYLRLDLSETLTKLTQ